MHAHAISPGIAGSVRRLDSTHRAVPLWFLFCNLNDSSVSGEFLKIRVCTRSRHVWIPKMGDDETSGVLISDDSKGGPEWGMPPKIFVSHPFGPSSSFLNFEIVWLTYAGLPNAFCKNSGHFVNSTRSKPCHNS